MVLQMVAYDNMTASSLSFHFKFNMNWTLTQGISSLVGFAQMVQDVQVK